MKDLLDASKLLLLDLASTLFFLVVFLLTKNIPLSVTLGMALGAAQMGWQFVRRAPVDAMQWMSLLLVLGSGVATLITSDPRFIMLKPSLIYGGCRRGHVETGMDAPISAAHRRGYSA